MKKILITGAGGYIGSVACSLFLDAGYEVVGVDNYIRGFVGALKVLQEKHGKEKLRYYDVDIRDGLADVLSKESNIDTVIHYAAFCNVGESELHPELYFGNNIAITVSLLEAMKQYNLKKIVFSSTCSIYGEPQQDFIDESHPIHPTSHPYSESKYMSERIVNWYYKIHRINYIFLRYFNVCGATDDGTIGDSKKPSFHVMQNAVRGALGIEEFKLTCPKVNTPDGTPIRDYVNVVDLNYAHIKAVEYLDTRNEPDIFNLGTGIGNSVLEIVETVKKITGKEFSVGQGELRKGDVSRAVASNEHITSVLGWKPTHSLEDSVRSLVTWYTSHPHGWEA